MKFSVLAAALAIAAGPAAARPAAPFIWENATVYFLLTDRFHNGDPRNDLAYGRKADAAVARGFAGGDLKGVTEKIRSGYFNRLGVDALWITPPVEQIHGSVDEGTGKSYGFHGYWAKDFTAVDANLGTEADVRELVDTAHKHGLRVILDVVMNHTGPVTAQDPVWPAAWVRTGPKCTYKDARTTIECTLVDNLPDIRTERDAAVGLPPHLVAKWKREGRYRREVAELNRFFKRTGYPRAPRYYLMKWHADWVRKYGFDGFRGDTVKHTEAGVWKDLKAVASQAYEDWKRANPSKKLGDGKFYMTSEVYGYGIGHGRSYDNGGVVIDYFAHGFDSNINFSLKSDANKGYEELFAAYSAQLNGPLKGVSVLNYVSSHDDGGPFDKMRTRPFESANKLLLTPGAAQIYYGDETARVLHIEGAEGDAHLRSFMNWGELEQNAARDGYTIAEVYQHWTRLGQFRRAHVAVGAGEHRKIADAPYTFSRTYDKGGLGDKVVVAIDAAAGASIDVGGTFAEGARVKDHYSGASAEVRQGKVSFPASGRLILIAAE